MEFFLVLIFLYLEQKKLRIWTLFMQCECGNLWDIARKPPYSILLRKNTVQEKFRTWVLLTQWKEQPLLIRTYRLKKKMKLHIIQMMYKTTIGWCNLKLNGITLKQFIIKILIQITSVLRNVGLFTFFTKSNSLVKTLSQLKLKHDLKRVS